MDTELTEVEEEREEYLGCERAMGWTLAYRDSVQLLGHGMIECRVLVFLPLTTYHIIMSPHLQTNLNPSDLHAVPAQTVALPPTLPTQIRVARSTPEDANCVLGIAIPAFDAFAHTASHDDLQMYLSTHFTLDHILAELNNPNKRFLLAIQGHECVGFSQLTIGTSEPAVDALAHKIELQRIYVAAEHHQGGVARVLMEATLQLASAEGYKNIWLGVRGQAEAFYGKCGFSRADEHEVDDGANIYIMVRSL